MNKQLEQAKQQAVDAKKAIATGAGAAEDEDGGRSALRKSKAEFAPRAAEGAAGGAASKLLRKKTKTGAAAV